MCTFCCSPILCQIVQSLVLCHLNYCSMVWSSAACGELRKFQVVQNRAARLVLGCSFRSNVNRMHDCLSWLTVEKRLSFNILVLFKTVISSKTPLFLLEQFVYSNSVHDHNTRGSSNGQLVLPRPITNALLRSFIYRSISLWNNLPLCCIRSKLAFKKKLKYYLRL